MSSEELEIGHLVMAGEGPAPGVVMIHHVWGLSDHTRDLAGRLAGEGFSVPLLALFGEDDALIPVAHVQELEERLRQRGSVCDVVLYPSAGHAFMNDTKPELYRPDAARDAWGRMVPFFRTHLA